jgi:hypothetical protein
MTPRICRALQLLRNGPRLIDSFTGLAGDRIREGLIDAGMAEPPLVETDGPRVFLTAAGRAALEQAEK